MLAWLDHHLDFDTFEVTFAGNTTRRSSGFTSSPRWHRNPLRISCARRTSTSRRAATIRASNALLEGLACGLPAAYLRSGGHPELVGEAGIGFDDAEELPAVFARLATELDERRRAISRPVARRGGGPLSRGAASVRDVLRRATAAPSRTMLAAYVPVRTSSWPDASRLFVVGDDFGWSIDDDRTRLTATAQAPRLRRCAGAVGAFREDDRPSSTTTTSGRCSRAGSTLAPARAQLFPRSTGHGRLSRVRSRVRGVEAQRASYRPGAGDTRRDARARDRCRRR